MKRFFDVAETVANWGSVASFTGMIAVVVLQVFARLLLPSAPAWTEESARFFFVYLVAFGIAHAVRRDGLVRLTLLHKWQRTRAYQGLELAIAASMSLFSSYLCALAWSFARSGRFESSPALGLSMSIAFASLVVLALAMALFSLEKALLAVSKLRTR